MKTSFKFLCKNTILNFYQVNEVDLSASIKIQNEIHFNLLMQFIYILYISLHE